MWDLIFGEGGVDVVEGVRRFGGGGGGGVGGRRAPGVASGDDQIDGRAVNVVHRRHHVGDPSQRLAAAVQSIDRRVIDKTKINVSNKKSIKKKRGESDKNRRRKVTKNGGVNVEMWSKDSSS